MWFVEKMTRNGREMPIPTVTTRLGESVFTFHLLLIGPIVHLPDRQLVNAILPRGICYSNFGNGVFMGSVVGPLMFFWIIMGFS